MTHSIHKEGDILQIYFGMIFHETRHHSLAHITSGALIHCALSLATRSTQTALQLGWWFRWAVFVMATLESQNIFCACTWSSNQSGGGAILALSSFLNQIPHQKEPEISVGIFSSWPLLTTTTACLIWFPLYDWHSFRNVMPLRYERLLQ